MALAVALADDIVANTAEKRLADTASLARESIGLTTTVESMRPFFYRASLECIVLAKHIPFLTNSLLDAHCELASLFRICCLCHATLAPVRTARRV